MAKRAVRDSWRPKGRYGNTAVAWLMVRRMVATVFVLAMVGVFLYIVLRPFFQPRTYMVYMTSGQQLPGSSPPIEYAFEDFESLTGLENALARRGGPPLVFSGVESPRRFEEQLGQITDLGLRGMDILVLYITAHGTVVGGEPYLKCANYSPAEPERGLYRIADLLDHLQQLPAKTKLLVLDAGREEPDFRAAMSGYAFPRFLEKEVRRVNDPTLWVFTANTCLERSHVSTSLRQSVFGYVMSQGLKGAADTDEDKQLRIDELCQFVRDNVSKWVEKSTDGNDSQTPQLFHAARVTGQRSPVLLSLEKLPNPTKDPNVQDDIEVAQRTDVGSVMSSVGEFIVGVSGQFGIPSPTQIKQRTKPLRDFTTSLLPSGDGADDGAADSPDNDGANGGSESEPGDLSELDWSQVAARRLRDAWKLASNVGDTSEPPSEVAPHLWRSILDELVWYDRLHRSGALADQQLVATQVGRIARALRFLAGEDVAEPATDSLGGKIHRWAPRVPLKHDEVHSLGLAEVVASLDHQELSEELQGFITDFDKAIWAPSLDQLSELIQKQRSIAEQFYECRLAIDLLPRSDISWELRRLALQTRRLAEQAAADLAGGAGWVRSEFESADRLRLEAERLIQSQADRDWRQLATTNLSDARTHYQNIRTILATVRDAVRTRDVSLQRSRELLRWHHLVSGDSIDAAPQFADFVELFDSVAKLDRALTAPVQDADEVQRRSEELRFALRQIQMGVDKHAVSDLTTPLTGNAWRLDVLTRSWLLDAESRNSLGPGLTKVASELDASFRFVKPRPTVLAPDLSIGDEIWPFVTRQLELEVRAARLSLCSSDARKEQLTTALPLDSLELLPPVKRALEEAGYDDVAAVADASIDALATATGQDNQTAASLRDQSRWVKLQSATNQLAEFYADLADAIVEMASARSADRNDRLRRWRAASRDLNLISGDFGTLTDLNLAARIRYADWNNLLAWHCDRIHHATADAIDAELAQLASTAEHYTRLANKIPEQIPLGDVASGQIELDVESELSLNLRQGEDNLDVQLRSKSDGNTAVWILLQYDPDLIRIRSAPGVPVYVEHTLRAQLRDEPQSEVGAGRTALRPRSPAQIRSYPYRPDLFDRPPTLELKANESQSLSIRVRRTPAARGQTKLIVKALGGGAYVRRTGQVRLPGHQLFQLLVADPATERVADPSTWTNTGDGILLHPYPNRPHEFAFLLKDVADRGGDVQIELSVPRRGGLNARLPEGALEPAAAAELLRLVGPRETIAETTAQIPPNGSALVRFPKPDETTPVAVTPVKDEAEDEDAQPPGRLIRHGLFMVITDASTGKKTLKRVQFAVQRPSRFLNATAGYDAASEYLTIDVEAVEPDAIPPEGLLLELALANTLPAESASRLKRRISPNNRRAQLFAQIPSDTEDEVTAWLHVNGYPRAFVFRVPCSDTLRNVPPLSDLREIRVVAPKHNAPFASLGLQEVRARIEVDAPVAAFSEPGADYVQVGIDSDQDLDLVEEDHTLRLPSDRQVDLFIQALQENGAMRVYTQVDDFDLRLPVTGLDNRRVYVLGRLVTGNSATLSRGPDRPPVQIALDGSGPVLQSVEIRPSRRMIVESEVSTLVTAIDALSRVVKVEVGFDELGTGDFAGVKEPAEAEPSDGANWEVKLKVPKLAIGPQRIWLRATDEVNNQTETSFPIEILPKPEPEPKQNGGATGNSSNATGPSQPATTQVSGRLVYSNRTVRDGRVRLVGPKTFKKTAAADGSFVIKDVPPGDYRLEATGYAGGNFVRKTTDITVDPPDLGPTRLNAIRLR